MRMRDLEVGKSYVMTGLPARIRGDADWQRWFPKGTVVKVTRKMRYITTVQKVAPAGEGFALTFLRNRETIWLKPLEGGEA